MRCKGKHRSTKLVPCSRRRENEPTRQNAPLANSNRAIARPLTFWFRATLQPRAIAAARAALLRRGRRSPATVPRNGPEAMGRKLTAVLSSARGCSKNVTPALLLYPHKYKTARIKVTAALRPSGCRGEGTPVSKATARNNPRPTRKCRRGSKSRNAAERQSRDCDGRRRDSSGRRQPIRCDDRQHPTDDCHRNDLRDLPGPKQISVAAPAQQQQSEDAVRYGSVSTPTLTFLASITSPTVVFGLVLAGGMESLISATEPCRQTATTSSYLASD